MRCQWSDRSDPANPTDPVRDTWLAGCTRPANYVAESIQPFASILETMLEAVAFASKLKMLGEDILRVSRHARVLGERRNSG